MWKRYGLVFVLLQRFTGLDGKGMWSHSHTPTYTILKTSKVFGHPELLYGILPNIIMIRSISRLLITFFTIALIKCHGHNIFNFFYLLFFFYVIVTWSFSFICYQLNTVKVTVSTKLQSLLRIVSQKIGQTLWICIWILFHQFTWAYV